MSWVQNSWLMVGLSFIINFSVPRWLGGNQFGYQHELVSFVASRNISAPQLSAGPLGGRNKT